jgi:hypothetical protein
MSIPPRGTPSGRSGPALRRRLLDRLQLPARVEEINLLSPRMRQITLRPAVTGLAWVPGQHVQVQVGARPGPIDMFTGQHRT